MLTSKQKELLMFIHERLKESGVPPSFDEMKEALDLKSKSGIHRLITALEERGFVRRLPHRARAMEIVRLPESVPQIRAHIAESRMEIDQARLLTLRAAWLMDTAGNKAARSEIAQIKVVAPRMALRVLDRAIQAHGGAGVSEDFPLARAWAHARILRLADGPDEVHVEAIAKVELAK